MGANGYAIVLVIGMVLFATGGGGWLTHGLLIVGAIGTVVTAFVGKR